MADRQIEIKGDADKCIIVSGDGNEIHIFQESRIVSEEKDAPAPDIGPNPYKGLSAFHEKDADRFFGRESFTRTLWSAYAGLHQPRPDTAPTSPRLLAVLGPSGSGKSSAARAGVIPELARKPLPGVNTGQVVVFTPGGHPLEALANILARVATGDPAPVEKAGEFTRVMKKESDQGQYNGLRRVADALPNIDNAPLLILVDQFEEIYSLCDKPEERRLFIENLLRAAADRSGRVSVVITLRSDFLTQTQHHTALSRFISNNHVIVPAMDRGEIRLAIAEPARQAGKPLDDATIELLIQQTEGHEGALPLLEFALTGIWEGMAAGEAPAETLNRIGDVGGALAGEASRLYEGLAEADKKIARRAFLKLVQLGEGVKDTRRRVPLSDMKAYAESLDQAQKVLRVFSGRGARLVTLSADPDSKNAETAEITHEALFEHWEDLKNWIETGREDIRLERRLSLAALAWNDAGRPAGSLWWQPPNLNLLKDFHNRQAEDMSDAQMAFHQASVKRDRWARMWRWTFVLTLVVLTAVSGGLAYKFDQSLIKAEKQKSLALKAVNALTYELADELVKIPRTGPIVTRVLKNNTRLLDEIYALDPDTAKARREKASNLSRMGNAALLAGDTDAALEAYKESNEIFIKLAGDDPNNSLAQRDLTVSYNNLGDLQLRLGNTDAALSAYEKAMGIRKKLAVDDPNNS
ncbi:MAG: ATP-binding protein, partial [Desulfobacterales bacterium]|nr:ATP-binding protein [Desulfobacterales bacterium]